MANVAKSLVGATSSSRFVEPNFWRDPVSGNGFQIQVQIPQNRVKSLEDIQGLRVSSDGPRALMGDVADVRYGTTMAEIDRYNMQRMVSLTANLHGEFVGDAAKQLESAVHRVGNPPKGVTVSVRGQVQPLLETVKLDCCFRLQSSSCFLLFTSNPYGWR